ncbi:hypothetical protein GOV14_00860 [Candidatus Pacearchaeota archaeon]|nr:hypothetical protein [Candidatus Pacearchaeota archaeon]
MAYPVGITEILNSWQQMGVFAYLLPFLLIFAIVFGILNKSSVLGENRGVQATIAVAVGLLSLQFDIVSTFFADIFPYAGIGISILLVAILLIGLLNSGSETVAKWLIFSIGAITFLVILYVLWSKYRWQYNLGGGMGGELFNVVWILVVIGAVIAITIVTGRKSGGGGGSSSSKSKGKE